MNAASPETEIEGHVREAREHVADGKLLDHLEKTLADAYRKEIDQEENVWRSLPFFAASLALQIAATVGIVGSLPRAEEGAGWLPIVLFAAIGAATVATIFFLAASIAPARFRYISSEPELRAQALALSVPEVAEALSMVKGSGMTIEPVLLFKNQLARQFALATHHNRLINQRRAFQRSLAGLCMLTSVLATLALVGVIVSNHIRGAAVATGERDGRQGTSERASRSGQGSPSGPGPQGEPPSGDRLPADARGP